MGATPETTPLAAGIILQIFGKAITIGLVFAIIAVSSVRRVDQLTGRFFFKYTEADQCVFVCVIWQAVVGQF